MTAGAANSFIVVAQKEMFGSRGRLDRRADGAKVSSCIGVVYTLLTGGFRSPSKVCSDSRQPSKTYLPCAEMP